MVSGKVNPGISCMPLLAILAVLVALTGCAIPAHVQVPPSFDTEPLVKKRSITAGIYYSKDLRGSVHVEELDLRKWEIPLGKASVSMFDRIFSSAFERVVDIKQWPPLNSDPPETDVIIEPILEEFSFTYPYDDSITYKSFLLPTGSRQWEAQISYRLNFYTADGNVVGSHRIQGGGTKRVEPPIRISQRRQLAIAVERAIWDAAAQFTVAIDTDDNIRHWLGSPMSSVLSTTASVDAQEPVESQDILAAFTVPDTTQEVDVIQCMMEYIGKENPSVKLMADDEFNRTMFPWFEPSTVPRTSEEMRSLLGQPLIRQKIQSLRIKHLVSIEGGTSNHQRKGEVGCAAGPGPVAGCIGLSWRARKSVLTATIWDLRKARVVDVVSASAQKTSFVAALAPPIPLPIWHRANPDAAACELLAEKVAGILQGIEDEPTAGSAQSRETEGLE